MLQKVKHHLLLPLTIPKMAFGYLMAEIEDNSIQNYVQGPDPERFVRISKEIDFFKLKKAS
jgi:hypothetical protein